MKIKSLNNNFNFNNNIPPTLSNNNNKDKIECKPWTKEETLANTKKILKDNTRLLMSFLKTRLLMKVKYKGLIQKISHHKIIELNNFNQRKWNILLKLDAELGKEYLPQIQIKKTRIFFQFFLMSVTIMTLISLQFVMDMAHMDNQLVDL